MKAIYYECFKLERKATRSVIKKNRNNFINVIGDKLDVEN